MRAKNTTYIVSAHTDTYTLIWGLTLTCHIIIRLATLFFMKKRMRGAGSSGGVEFCKVSKIKQVELAN